MNPVFGDTIRIEVVLNTSSHPSRWWRISICTAMWCMRMQTEPGDCARNTNLTSLIRSQSCNRCQRSNSHSEVCSGDSSAVGHTNSTISSWQTRSPHWTPFRHSWTQYSSKESTYSNCSRTWSYFTSGMGVVPTTNGKFVAWDAGYNQCSMYMYPTHVVEWLVVLGQLDNAKYLYGTLYYYYY